MCVTVRENTNSFDPVMRQDELLTLTFFFKKRILYNWSIILEKEQSCQRLMLFSGQPVQTDSSNQPLMIFYFFFILQAVMKQQQMEDGGGSAQFFDIHR